MDQLRIALDDQVGMLLKGKPDIETEALFCPGSLLCRPHDTIAATRDDHEVLCHNPPRKFACELKIRLVRTGSGGAKYRDLTDIRIFLKDRRSIAHFTHGTTHQLKIGNRDIIETKTHHSLHHVTEKISFPT